VWCYVPRGVVKSLRASRRPGVDPSFGPAGAAIDRRPAVRPDPRHPTASLAAPTVDILAMTRPWPGRTDEARDLWGMLGSGLVCWIVFYRAGPAVAAASPRVLLVRMLPGIALGAFLVAVGIPLLGRGAGWSETAVAVTLFAGGWVVVAGNLVLRAARRPRV
jgi:hypothetical protein